MKAPFPRHVGTFTVTVTVLAVVPCVCASLQTAGLLPDGYVRFDRPWGTLAPALILPFLAARISAYRRDGPRPTQQSLTGVWLVLAAAMACGLAVAGLSIGAPVDRLAILVALDRSRSIDLVPDAEPRARRELAVAERGMHKNDLIGTIVFADDAATEDPPRPKSDLPPPQRIELGRDATDIAAAIRRALAEIPADAAARIVLVTDGVATRGNAIDASALAVAAGVPIDVVPLDQRRLMDVRAVQVRTASHADEGETLGLSLVTSSTKEAEVELRILVDGEPRSRRQIRIAAGEDVVVIREQAPGPGLHRYDVEISALDASLDEAPDDNSASAFVQVRGAASALVLEGDKGKETFVAGALQQAAFRVDAGSATSVPADVSGLVTYDLVVLSDLPASELSPGQIQALATYTRDLGGGLLLLGGDRSMGPGGYAKTPLEEVAPVSFDLKQERRRGSLAEVIAIDYSGSMAASVGHGETKLALANEAAVRSASLLGPGDCLGVEHVDTKASWTVPLSPLVPGGDIERKIRGVTTGGGGIYVDVALREGYAALDKETVNLKHMLLFADGDDAERLTGCRALAAAALRRGITTSVVALGRGNDLAELEALSKTGSGRFYLVEDATRLPSVFAQETILAARAALHEVDFHVASGVPSPATRGIDFLAAPALRGYVVTIEKPRASVLLSGPEGDPILATWSVGLGRAAAFTSDLKDRWGVNWTNWPGAARLIGQLGREISRRPDDPRVRLDADASGGVLQLHADVIGDDGRSQSFRRLSAHVGGPDGFLREVPLEPVGAGAYAAKVPLSRPGAYIATAHDEGSGETVGTTGAVLTAGEELRPTGTDRGLLRRIAAITGGRVRENLAGLFDDRPERRFSYRPLSPTLLAIAALALLLAVAVRRLSLPNFAALATERARGHFESLGRASSSVLPSSVLPSSVLPSSVLPSSRQPSSTLPVDGGGAAPPPFARQDPSPKSAEAAPATGIASAPQKPLTAAEILVQRRRKRDP